jgi:hypothetical protein
MLQFLDLFRRTFVNQWARSETQGPSNYKAAKFNFILSQEDMATNTKEKIHSGKANSSSVSQGILKFTEPEISLACSQKPFNA